MEMYIVTAGAYEDYTIEKVFNNREAAERFVLDHNATNDIGYQAEVEVYDVASDYESANARVLRWTELGTVGFYAGRKTRSGYSVLSDPDEVPRIRAAKGNVVVRTVGPTTTVMQDHERAVLEKQWEITGA